MTRVTAQDCPIHGEKKFTFEEYCDAVADDEGLTDEDVREYWDMHVRPGAQGGGPIYLTTGEPYIDEPATCPTCGGGDEYTPEYQDEYRRLWHEAAAKRDELKAALLNLERACSLSLLAAKTPSVAAAVIEARRALNEETL